ncbi:hypothetical protein [Terribacillus saccharophilus]|uniref:hypothetical protein n=1 Tax=Terribacillus saccharophilus TaxID=361277 RepID=UPI0020D1466D|nr:hypothetical protein [Terribacillus saccharophilus]
MLGVLMFYLGLLTFLVGIPLFVVFLALRNKKWSWVSGLILVFGFIVFISGVFSVWNKSVSLVDSADYLNPSNLTEIEKILVATKAQEITEIEQLVEHNRELRENIEENTSTLETLQNKVNDAEEDLLTLRGEMKKAEDEPIGLGAGVDYRADQDLPANSYQVVPKEGAKSRVIVKAYSGKVKVDIVIEAEGDVPSFVLKLESMDTIEVDASVDLIPLQITE